MTLYVKLSKVLDFKLSDGSKPKTIQLSLSVKGSQSGALKTFPGSKLEFKKDKMKIALPKGAESVIFMLFTESKILAELEIPIDCFPKNKVCDAKLEFIPRSTDVFARFKINFHYDTKKSSAFSAEKSHFHYSLLDEFLQAQQKQNDKVRRTKKKVAQTEFSDAFEEPNDEKQNFANFNQGISPRNRNKNQNGFEDEYDGGGFQQNQMNNKVGPEEDPQENYWEAENENNHQQQLIIPSATPPVSPQTGKKRGDELLVDISAFQPPPFMALLSYQPIPFQQPDMFQGCIQTPQNNPQTFGTNQSMFPSFWRYSMLLSRGETTSLLENEQPINNSISEKVYTMDDIQVENQCKNRVIIPAKTITISIQKKSGSSNSSKESKSTGSSLQKSSSSSNTLKSPKTSSSNNLKMPKSSSSNNLKSPKTSSSAAKTKKGKSKASKKKNADTLIRNRSVEVLIDKNIINTEPEFLSEEVVIDSPEASVGKKKKRIKSKGMKKKHSEGLIRNRSAEVLTYKDILYTVPEFLSEEVAIESPETPVAKKKKGKSKKKAKKSKSNTDMASQNASESTPHESPAPSPRLKKKKAKKSKKSKAENA